MKIIIKLESLANKILLWIGNFLLRIILKYTPTKIKKIYEISLTKFISCVTFIKNLPKKIFSFFYNKIKKFIGKVKQTLTGLNPKEKLIVYFQYTKAFIKMLTIENFRNQIKRVYLLGKKNIQIGFNRIPLSIKWSVYFGMGSIFLLSITSIYIFKSIQKKELPTFTKDEMQQEIRPSVKTQRAPYFRREYQYIDLDEVNIPVYVSKLSSMKLLVVDVVIEASNRFIPQYFVQYEHEIRDHLYTHLEPVIPGFPLELEGKHIVRNKLISELNLYLKKKKISGRINAIHIQGIIAD